MATLSQLFNRNKISLEMLLVAGGGGAGGGVGPGGTAVYSGGGGGGGGLEYVSGFLVSRGSTLTITVGGGGARANVATRTAAANGGFTSVVCPDGSFSVAGGGGGGSFASDPLLIPAPGVFDSPAKSGGCGGGMYANYSAPGFGNRWGWPGAPAPLGIYNQRITNGPSPFLFGYSATASVIATYLEQNIKTLNTAFGFKAGFPGVGSVPAPLANNAPLAGSTNAAAAYINDPGGNFGTSYGGGGRFIVMDNDDTTFATYGFGRGGIAAPIGSTDAALANSGRGGSSVAPGVGLPAIADGDNGIVFVKWPSAYPAATATTGTVVDRSPATPGFYTYKFTSSGTITLG